MNSKRFGEDSLCEIDQHIDELTPINTKKSKAYTWKQFECFCAEKGYALEPETSVAKLASIMKDFAFNMKKKDGQEYKEGVIKTIWNSVAKILQQKYKEECNVLFDPFRDVIFSNARSARDAKRKQLQLNPEKRKTSSSSLTREELEKIISLWDEETPEGLQRKFYHIASYELAWRGGEAVNCLIDHFTDEINNTGKTTGRIIYNPVFSKTSQGGSRPLTMDKWLIENLANPDKCPVRLYRKMIAKRGKHITTRRLFLTPNPAYKNINSIGFFKNCPLGKNQISNWTAAAAKEIGLDVKKRRITNHSNRSTAVSNLAEASVGENQIAKITGHSSVTSIKSYLQMSESHHSSTIQKMRLDAQELSVNQDQQLLNDSTRANVVYNNCVINNYYNS